MDIKIYFVNLFIFGKIKLTENSKTLKYHRYSIKHYIICYDIIKEAMKIWRTQLFIENFALHLKQSYHIVESVKKQSKNPRVAKWNKGKLMLLSKCVVCESKKSRFFKKQEASGLLSNLRIRTPLSKIPLSRDILS